MDQRLPDPVVAAPPDWRALCQELLGALENEGHAHWPGGPDGDPLIEQARALLAQPEPEVADGPAVPESREPVAVVGEPSDEELLELAQYHSISYTMSDGTVVYPLQEGCDMRDDVLSFARAVLSRYGRPASAPAGEVADEARYWAKELRDQADDLSPSLELFGLIHRAADLLEQRQAAPVPVPVNDRLPEPEDCNEQGRVWWWRVGQDGVGDWIQKRLYPSADACAFLGVTHWLPFNALTLPSGEVE